MSQTPAPTTPTLNKRRRGSSLLAYGEPMVWLTGGALAVCVLMVISLITFVVWQGGRTFWPVDILRIETHGNRTLMGELFREQFHDVRVENLANLHPLAALRGEKELLPLLLDRIRLVPLPDESLRATVQGLLLNRPEAAMEEALIPIIELTAQYDPVPTPAEIAQKAVPLLTQALASIQPTAEPERLALFQEILEQAQALAEPAEEPDAQRIAVFQQRMLSARRPLVARVADARPLVAAAVREASGVQDRERSEFEVEGLGIEAFRAYRQSVSDRELAVRETLDLLFDNVRAPFRRRLIRTGNFDLTQVHFEWVSDLDVRQETHPEWAFIAERLVAGRFYGFPRAFSLLHYTGPAVDPEPTLANADENGDGTLDFDEIDRFNARLLAERRERAEAIVQELTPRIEALNRDLQPGQRVELRFVSGNRWLTREQLTDFTRIEAVAEYFVGEEIDGQNTGYPLAWSKFEEHHRDVRARWRDRRSLETHDNGRISQRLELARLSLLRAQRRLGVADEWMGLMNEVWRAEQTGDEATINAARDLLAEIEQQFGRPSEEFMARLREFEAEREAANRDFDEITRQIQQLNRENSRFVLHARTAQGQDRNLLLFEIVRAYVANQTTTGNRLAIYGSRWWEFVSDDPREANSEGGVFPAIFGTVVMTLIMSMAVVPFGVLAALYLREYAKPGPVVSTVRIAINNLAGVPSIVFGVFGLGFFCYVVGVWIDEWFFPEKLPVPTFGKGGLIWASLTLALLTLPVVIVATEEALAAVPGSMREGSYACGASKWQTIKRIVLPRAMPGIMTGMILAMARGAGEVAPLMLVGAVKLAPELPGRIDRVPPYFHVESSFMHLGFHIYDLGFQSQNSEAARPMVFTTTLLLIALIAILNIAAIFIRSRLRRKFVSAAF